MFDQLNNYYQNNKIVIELNRSKFLKTKLTNFSGAYKFSIYWKNKKPLHHEPPKLQNAISEVQSVLKIIVQKKKKKKKKSFKRVSNVDTLKYPALNSVKLNQDNFFEEISQIH